MAEPRSLIAVSLTVHDMPKSLAFYRLLGLAIPDEAVFAVDGAGHHVAIEMPGGLMFEMDSAAMTRSYLPDWSAGTGSTSFIFAAATREAVDELYTSMTGAGHHGRVAPFDAFWGARYAVVNDPDGNHVGIMSPMHDAHASAPPPL